MFLQTFANCIELSLQFSTANYLAFFALLFLHSKCESLPMIWTSSITDRNVVLLSSLLAIINTRKSLRECLQAQHPTISVHVSNIKPSLSLFTSHRTTSLVSDLSYRTLDFSILAVNTRASYRSSYPNGRTDARNCDPVSPPGGRDSLERR